MPLRVVGAGLPRTGTTSLKAALEQLLGAGCYHMYEVFARGDEQVRLWLDVLDGTVTTLNEILAADAAAVDWPASSFWRELVDRNPDAIVVLSQRADATTWWRSVDRTVWEVTRRLPAGEDYTAMIGGLMARLGVDDLDDPDQAMAAYEAHNQRVREAVPADRLVEWQPADGWSPLCEALGLPLPSEPFPHNNTTADFRALSGWD